MAFYRAAVEFRNAVERMQIRRGHQLDVDHLWRGFGATGGPPNPSADDGGLAWSRVPLHPPPSSGGANVELEEPDAIS
jgi:hypothetical protein